MPTPTTGNIQELRTAIGFGVEGVLGVPTLGTPEVAATMWSLRQTSRTIAAPLPGFEDDSQEFGKGDSWAHQRFPTGLDVSWPWEGYLTSQNASMCAVFGLGNPVATTSGTNGQLYTCTPMVQATMGINLPSTTLLQTIRQGGAPILDVAFPGCVCEEFSISIKQGIGRQNATMRSTWVGLGTFVQPSTITMPTLYTETNINATAATVITIATQNYVTNTRFMSADFSYKNNVRLATGYYPGSGTQQVGSGPIFSTRGRMRRGDPVASFSFVAEYIPGSVELTDLLAGTSGSAEINIIGATIAGATPSAHTVNILIGLVYFHAVQLSDIDGIITCMVTCDIMETPTLVTGTGLLGGIAAAYNTVPAGGVLSMAVVTNQSGIGLVCGTGGTEF
jgi:hypothetical protein